MTRGLTSEVAASSGGALRPIAEIDRQLYTRYGLDEDEIAFLEAEVEPMDQ